MTLWFRRLAPTVLLLVLVPACSLSEAGTARPAGGDSTGAVVIEKPLDLAAVANNPCGLLTPQQLDSISPGLEATAGTTSFGAPECVWDNRLVSLRAVADVNTGQGIDVKLRQPGVKRIEVVGYPAGQYGNPSPDTCFVSVGVAPDIELIMDFNNSFSEKPEHQRACEYVNTLAAMVIDNLPPKN